MAGVLRTVVLVVCLTTTGCGFAEAGETVVVDVELIIAVDVSGSMDAEEFALQREGYVAAIGHPDFLGAILAGEHRRIALAYVEWSASDHQSVIVPWRLIDGAAAAIAFADRLGAQPLFMKRGTSISAALLFGTHLFDANSFDGVRRVIDVSGDGPNNYGPEVTAARDYAVGKGVVINGLPILIRPSPLYPAMDRYYRDCVVGGVGSFVMSVTSEEGFAEAIRQKLVIDVAGRPAGMEAAVVRVRAEEPADCMIGERMRTKYADPYLPGL